METFTQTSDGLYTHHYYELHQEGGVKTIWEDYEELRNYWMLNGGWGMSYVEVKDRPVSSQSGTRSKAKGFS